MITRAAIMKALAGSSWRAIAILDDGRVSVECSSEREAQTVMSTLERTFPGHTCTLAEGWGDALDVVEMAPRPADGPTPA